MKTGVSNPTKQSGIEQKTHNMNGSLQCDSMANGHVHHQQKLMSAQKVQPAVASGVVQSSVNRKTRRRPRIEVDLAVEIETVKLSLNHPLGLIRDLHGQTIFPTVHSWLLKIQVLSGQVPEQRWKCV